MAQSKFLLVSLEESKAKELAQVLSNDTSRRILDYLAERHDASESQMAKELDMPMPTVHYNLKHLVEAKLVQAKEFHYSEKGKEVLHYSLANRYIIIAPKSSALGIRDKLKSLLPALTIVGAIGFAYQYLTKTTGQLAVGTAEKAMAAAPMAEEAAADGAMALRAAPALAAAPPLPMPLSEPNYALWLLIGAAAVIICYLLIEALRNRWRR